MTKNTDTAIASSPPSFMQKVEVAQEKVEKAVEKELTAQELDEYEQRLATVIKATSRLKEQADYLSKISDALAKVLPQFITLNPMGQVLDRYIDLETQFKAVVDKSKLIADQITGIREVTFPARLDADEAQTVTSKDTGSRVTRSTRVLASIKSDPTGDTLERAYEWLRKPVFYELFTDEELKTIADGGSVALRPMHPWRYDDEGELVLREGVNDDEQPDYGPLIKETVNSSSLSALAKEILGMGRELPDDLFNVYTKDGVSITKGKAKK